MISKCKFVGNRNILGDKNFFDFYFFQVFWALDITRFNA